MTSSAEEAIVILKKRKVRIIANLSVRLKYATPIGRAHYRHKEFTNITYREVFYCLIHVNRNSLAHNR